MSATIAAPSSPFEPGATGRPWGRKDGRTIYECPATGALYFAREDLGHEDYQDYYPYLQGFDRERTAWELAVRRRKYRRQLAQMARFVEGRTLLDIGAGPGYLVRVAEEEGWAARGVEIAEDAVSFGEVHYGARYVALDDVPAESISAITCHHVLEHVDDSRGFLARMREKLEPGGLLVLHVPHQQPLTFAMRDRIGKWRGAREDFCCLYGDIHISGFTSSSLKAFVEANGFETHFVKTAGMWTRYYDPFFLRTYVRGGAWLTAARKAARHAVESFGSTFGKGDWVIGYFARRGG